MNRYLTPEEVCDILQITLSQLRGIRERREISWCKVGCSVRFTMQDVEDYVERVRVKAQRTQILPLTEVTQKTKKGPGRPQKSYQAAPGYVPGMRVV